MYANWHFRVLRHKWFHSYPPIILADNSDLQAYTILSQKILGLTGGKLVASGIAEDCL